MARRQLVQKHKSDSVQGDGSWVEMRKMTVAEMRKVEEHIDQEGNYEYSIRKIEENLVKWNWADEEGQELPLPKNDPTVLDGLTAEEFNFLCRCLVGGEQALKN